MTLTDIGYERALALVHETIEPLRAKGIPVADAGGLVLARDAVAVVDSPSVSASARDGFAVRSDDVRLASPEAPVTLRVTATANAGGAAPPDVAPGEAVEVMTGARLPGGCDAVVSVEYCSRNGLAVEVSRDAEPGRNVIPRGVDVSAGSTVASAGTRLAPAMTGLVAAGGLSVVEAHPLPRVALVATGDEVVAPGRELRPGQLYASNLVTLRSWLTRFGIQSVTRVVPDDPALIRECIEELLTGVDAVLTSGGAWKSVRDHSVSVLGEMGFDMIFHRVKLAPGKAAALGVRGSKVALCLPGGPPSNEMAFLQLALPGLLAMAGDHEPPFPTVRAIIDGQVRKQRADGTWTNFFQATLHERDGLTVAKVLRPASRLESQARAKALIVLPAGVMSLSSGDDCHVQILARRV